MSSCPFRRLAPRLDIEPYTEHMTIQRMDQVGIVVDDLAAATESFVELGLELRGEGSVEGRWADRIVGLDGLLRTARSWSRSVKRRPALSRRRA